MSNRVSIVYVVTHETKLDGKWHKHGRVFSHLKDAESEIEQLSWFAKQRRPLVRKVPAKPEYMVAYM